MPWRWPWYREPKTRAAPAARHPLREFVYLDEVSVYSLLASRSGPIPTDFTDTETESLKGEASSGLSVGVPGTKGEVGSRAETATSSSSQIVRKSSAQARFKQFLKAEQHGFVFSVDPEASGGSVATSFRRGDLFEMSVELDADETFRASTTIASLVEILNQEGAQLIAPVDRVEMQQAVAFNRILERLLVGLVPIRAKAVEYAVVRRNGTPRIIERSALVDLPSAERESAKSLSVVGFAQQDLFWKDLPDRIVWSAPVRPDRSRGCRRGAGPVVAGQDGRSSQAIPARSGGPAQRGQPWIRDGHPSVSRFGRRGHTGPGSARGTDRIRRARHQ